jgi:hypothetical protein
MARTVGNRDISRKRFGPVEVVVGHDTGRIQFRPHHAKDRLNQRQRDELTAWVWDILSGWDCVSPTATPITLRDQLWRDS